MTEYTTLQIAEYLGVQRQTITAHITKGNLKAKYKALLNDRPRYYISHKEYLRFCDWWLYDKGKNVGVTYKKTPNIDEYDLEPNNYNCYVSLKIQRDKAILEARILNKHRFKVICKSFNLCLGSVGNIVKKNNETDFYNGLLKMRDIFK